MAIADLLKTQLISLAAPQFEFRHLFPRQRGVADRHVDGAHRDRLADLGIDPIRPPGSASWPSPSSSLWSLSGRLPAPRPTDGTGCAGEGEPEHIHWWRPRVLYGLTPTGHITTALRRADHDPGHRGGVQPAGAARAARPRWCPGRPRPGGRDQFGGVQPGAIYRPDVRRLRHRLVQRATAFGSMPSAMSRSRLRSARIRCRVDRGRAIAALRSLATDLREGIRYTCDASRHRRPADPADRARRRRTAPQRIAAGLRRRRVPRRRRRPVDPGLGDRRRRDLRGRLARPSRPCRRA